MVLGPIDRQIRVICPKVTLVGKLWDPRKLRAHKDGLIFLATREEQVPQIVAFRTLRVSRQAMREVVIPEVRVLVEPVVGRLGSRTMVQLPTWDLDMEHFCQVSHLHRLLARRCLSLWEDSI